MNKHELAVRWTLGETIEVWYSPMGSKFTQKAHLVIKNRTVCNNKDVELARGWRPMVGSARDWYAHWDIYLGSGGAKCNNCNRKFQQAEWLKNSWEAGAVPTSNLTA